MKKIVLLLLVLDLFSCKGQEKKDIRLEVASTTKINMTDTQWKAKLTKTQYEVLRKKETEKPFTGKYWNKFDKGKYVCVACGNTLFNSDSKFHSDCGWPSFDQAVKGAVTYADDYSFGMKRTEVSCAKCGGHLGHLFNDGPKETTGKRFCTNSIAIEFIPEK